MQFNKECSCIFYKYRTLGCFIVVQVIISVSKQNKDHSKEEKSMFKGQMWKIIAVTIICIVTGSYMLYNYYFV